MRCRNCWRFGHTNQKCRSKPTCTNCSSTQHSTENCTSQFSKCINCRDEDDSCSPRCPKLLLEQNICQLTADRGISFTEARDILSPRTSYSQSSQNHFALSSQQEFPNLTQRSHQTQNSIIHPAQNSNHSSYKSNDVRNKTVIPATPTQQSLYRQALSSQSQDDIPPGQHTNPNYHDKITSQNDSFHLINFSRNRASI